ncbi:MAG: choice-of-anchor D domain-containing protein [Acidobacteria bacterium]|nr:choice-of-anchor D domain-containing protein [Acidobacteriota bacterium]
MEQLRIVRLSPKGLLFLLVFLAGLPGCGGGSSGSNSQATGNPQASLTVSPAALNFGDVTVGASSTLTGTLMASNSDVIVSSASWNGAGFSVTGITFPITVSPGKTTTYTVTFTPSGVGAASGNISFTNNATDGALQQSIAGTGTSSGHSVTLSWTPSASAVAGYNVYRGTQAAGPYSKLNSSLVSGTSYTDSVVLAGSTYYYVASSVDKNNLEGGYSNQATATIP